jgi:hypothetical protein
MSPGRHTPISELTRDIKGRSTALVKLDVLCSVKREFLFSLFAFLPLSASPQRQKNSLPLAQFWRAVEGSRPSVRLRAYFLDSPEKGRIMLSAIGHCLESPQAIWVETTQKPL